MDFHKRSLLIKALALNQNCLLNFSQLLEQKSWELLVIIHKQMDNVKDLILHWWIW